MHAWGFRSLASICSSESLPLLSEPCPHSPERPVLLSGDSGSLPFTDIFSV